MLADAIAHYHDLLSDRMAEDCQEQIDAHTQRLHFRFGDRPICNVLRPRFLTRPQYQTLQHALKGLLPAFRRIHHLGLQDPTFRRQFHLSEQDEQLLTIEPGFDPPFVTSRLDAFMIDDSHFQFNEFNAEPPAGPAYVDTLTDMFLGLRVMRDFLKRYQLLPLPARPGVLHGLLDAYAQWQGHRTRLPHIAIVDWKEVPSYSEFVLFRQYFREQGFPCEIVDPREIEYHQGRLRCRDFPIDLIYKRVLISELLQVGGWEQPLLRAVREGNVCLANSFRCKLLHQKASLAVLSDERNASLFDPLERQAIDQHIPWTRVVEERITRFQHQEIDLVPYLLAHREQFVLKPNDEYGGKGIVLGWTVDATTWEQAVRTALTTPYVVQQRIPIPSEPFPSWHHGRVHFLKRLYDTDPFIAHGQTLNGVLTRISTEPIVNVTAGGGSTVPTFLLEPR